jgi:DNA polymerase I-like protein with 3'-5' exonuclease and polymerase domains
MSAFAFGGISVTSVKKLKDKINENILLLDEYKPDEPYALVLVDKHYEGRKVKSISNFVKKYFNSYRIVLASYIAPTEENIKGGISNFFKQNKTPFEQYLESSGVIVTSGAALYAVSHDDLQVGYFYDVITNPKSYVFDSKCKRYVFPIDSFSQFITFGQSLAPYWETYKANFARWQLDLAIKQYEELASDQELDEVKLHRITSTEEFTRVIKEHSRYKNIAWDLETSGFSHFRNKIGVITFSFDGKNGYICQWDLVDKNILNDCLKTKTQIGANLKFDCKFLWKNGVPHARIDEDILQLGHVLNEIRSNSLKTNSWFYTKHGGYESELDEFVSNTGETDYTKIPLQVLEKYATMDAIVTYQVWEKQKDHLAWVDEKFPNEKNDIYTMTSYYRDIMMPSLRSFAKMEYSGMYVSIKRMENARETFLAKIKEIENELRLKMNIVGNFDFNSLKILGQKIKALGWPDLGQSKAGDFLTGEDQLERWKQLGHKEAEMLQELRTMNTLLNTFIGRTKDEGWGKYINLYDDGSHRMCANYSHMLADTGRSKCREPNLQQIPANDEIIPKCIDVPSDEYVILAVDYASLQVRLAGIDAKDNMLYKVYNDKKLSGDFHSTTAWPIYAKDKKFIEVKLDGGTDMQFLITDKVDITRAGVHMVVSAGDLQPSDDLHISGN